METVYEVSHWFHKRFKGECRAQEAWKVLRFVFLEKPNAKLERGLRGFRAIARLSVFSKWYTTVLVDLLREENLHVAAAPGDNYIPETLGVAGRPPDRSAARILQI